MQEASISARHQAGSLIPGAPTSQFQHRPPCNGRQTGEYRRLKFLHALTFYHRAASKNTRLPPPPSPKPTFRLPASQRHVRHCPGKANAGPRFQGQRCPQPPACLRRGLGRCSDAKGCFSGCEGQATSTCLRSAPATASSRNPLNPSIRPETPSSPPSQQGCRQWGEGSPELLGKPLEVTQPPASHRRAMLLPQCHPGRRASPHAGDAPGAGGGCRSTGQAAKK